MDSRTFNDLIKNNLPIIFDKYNFSIVHSASSKMFGDCKTILKSSDSIMRISTEKGQVQIEISLINLPYDGFTQDLTPGSKMRWYDLAVITSFITRGPNQINWEYIIPEKGIDKKTRLGNQMKRINELMTPYWDETIKLFEEKNFASNQEQLASFIKQRRESLLLRWEEISKNTQQKQTQS